MARTEAEKVMQVPVVNQSKNAICSAWGPSDHLGVASDPTRVSVSIEKSRMRSAISTLAISDGFSARAERGVVPFFSLHGPK